MTVYEHAYAWAAEHEHQPGGVAEAYGEYFEELDKAGEVTVLTSHANEFPRWQADQERKWADAQDAFNGDGPHALDSRDI